MAIVAVTHGKRQWSPALRLLIDRGRATDRRPAAIAAALAARAAGLCAHTVWPTVRQPRFAADMGHPASAAWLRATFEPEAPERRFPDPATWSALRTRGLVSGPPSRLATGAIARATGRHPAGMRLALYSPTGASNSKVACFAFDAGASEPALVVKAMPERRFADRLRHETEIVEEIRPRMDAGPRAGGALPLRPLLAGTVGDDYVVVQPVDTLAAATGAVAEPAAALEWLRAFQEATTLAAAPWREADTDAALGHVRYAWGRARPAVEPEVTARAHALLRALEGQPVRRCAQHGDFWHGNLAQRGHELRVYDWEWARAEGHPFFDLWTTELGPLRRAAELGAADLIAPLRDALVRVEGALDRQGVDPRFAIAALAPSLGELVFRVRRSTGSAGGAEAESVRLMDAAAELAGSAAR
jgi:hypothetical protein